MDDGNVVLYGTVLVACGRTAGLIQRVEVHRGRLANLWPTGNDSAEAGYQVTTRFWLTLPCEQFDRQDRGRPGPR